MVEPSANPARIATRARARIGQSDDSTDGRARLSDELSDAACLPAVGSSAYPVRRRTLLAPMPVAPPLPLPLAGRSSGPKSALSSVAMAARAPVPM